MNPNEERIARLLKAYLQSGQLPAQGTGLSSSVQPILTPSERAELFNAISQDDTLLSRLTEQLPVSFTASAPVDTTTRQQILDTIFRIGKETPQHSSQVTHQPTAEPLKVIRPVHRVHFLRTGRWIAAAVLVLLITGAWFWFRSVPHREVAVVRSPADLSPGHNKATLTLADGSTVVLDSSGSQVIQQGSIAIHEQSGHLKYDARNNTTRDNNTTIAYNTLVTPRGGQFRVTLPDGTQVWLNTASSLRYPTVFAGKERLVEVTGEAYFEVAKETARPFKVKINDQTEIEVLGTAFNVNAYNDEASINTTLLEGVVNINAYHHTQKLRSGQQAQVNTAKADIRVADKVNTGQTTAWKNGIFDFDQADIKTIMRQIGRWYDVEVVYEAGVDTEEKFVGEMQRNLSLTQVLKGFENMGLKFKIENGRRLIVMP